MPKFDLLGSTAGWDWQDHSGDPGNLISGLVAPYVLPGDQQRFDRGRWTLPRIQNVSDVYGDWGATIGPHGVPRIDIPLNPLTQANDTLLTRYGEAIAQIESGGKYDAVGPETKGDRAYGRYQVMGKNIPEWTREALGRSLSPQEFLASPEAQDAVFRHRFGSYVRQYGSAADAASAWFTGRPVSSASSGATDVLGTSGKTYVDRFLAALEQGPAGAASAAGANALQQAPTHAGIVDQLLGLNGTPRYQLWPERLARSALTAPADAMSGKLGVPGSREFTEAAVPRTLDIASIPAGGLVNPELGAAGVLGGKLTSVRGPAEAAAGASAPMFYSTAEQTLRNAGFQRASPSQWLAYLRNAQGVKGEELEWTGLADRLSNATESQLTKADLLQHLAENQVDLREVAKGAGSSQPIWQLRYKDGSGMFQTYPSREAAEEAIRSIGADDRIEVAHAPSQSEVPTKYGNYVLPGAEPGSYREALLTLPERNDTMSRYRELDRKMQAGTITPEELQEFHELDMNPPPSNNYRSSHWDEPNVLGHVRMNDRQVSVPGSDKPLNALFLEELQSDWHQQGRREGYRGDAKSKAIADEFGGGYPVPNAPFKTSWPELLLKRMIREAAEGGYDALAWTPGEVQAARYDLSKQVKSLVVNRVHDGDFTLTAELPDGSRQSLGEAIAPSKLADVIGKDLAKKISDDPVLAGVGGQQTYRGLDLKVGGEGMLKFYDDMLPSVAQKIVKKYGGKVELGSTQAGPKSHSGGGYSGDLIMEELGPAGRRERGIPEDEAGRAEWFRNLTSQQRSKLFEDYANTKNTVPVHVLRLTPELRKRALSQGFPLFSTGVPLSVRGSDGQPRTLHPVDYDPFSDEGLRKGASL